MFCCEEPYNLECYGSCECLRLGIDAEQSGNYVFEYSYGIPNTVHKQTLRNVVAGQELYLPFQVNENSTLFLKIKQPDGTYFNIVPCECFVLRTFPNLSHGFSEYGSGCNLPAEDLNIQEQFDEPATVDQVLTESGDAFKTIQINPVVHSGQPADSYRVMIADNWIDVDSTGKFTVNLPAGTYDITIIPVSTFGVFAPISLSINLI